MKRSGGATFCNPSSLPDACRDGGQHAHIWVRATVDKAARQSLPQPTCAEARAEQKPVGAPEEPQLEAKAAAAALHNGREGGMLLVAWQVGRSRRLGHRGQWALALLAARLGEGSQTNHPISAPPGKPAVAEGGGRSLSSSLGVARAGRGGESLQGVGW